MKLEFNGISFNGIGAKAAVDDLMWGCLSLFLKDLDTEHIPSVELKLFLPKKPDVTLTELQDEAHQHAVALLTEALNLLQSNSVADLEKIEAKRKANEKASLDASLSL